MDRDALLRQYGVAAGSVQFNTRGLSQEESLHSPEPGGNCANWVLGDTTVTALAFMAFHDAYHAGQLGLLRRVAGHEGQDQVARSRPQPNPEAGGQPGRGAKLKAHSPKPTATGLNATPNPLRNGGTVPHPT